MAAGGRGRGGHSNAEQRIECTKVSVRAGGV